MNKKEDTILDEVNHGHSIPSYIKENEQKGIIRALKKIEQDKELLADLMLEQQKGV